MKVGIKEKLVVSVLFSLPLLLLLSRDFFFHFDFCKRANFSLIAAQTCFCQVAVFLGYFCAVMDALILLLSSPGVDLANRPCVIELDYEPVISIGLWLMKSKTKPAIAHRNRD